MTRSPLQFSISPRRFKKQKSIIMSFTSDSVLSASQLRKRYKSLPDDELSAAQLRARNCIPGNKFHHKNEVIDSSIILFLVALLLILSGGVALQLL